MSFADIHKRCLITGNKEKAEGVARFFKTGKGEYGEGDIFLGINALTVRTLAKEFKELGLAEIKKLFESEIHEERMIGIAILNLQYEKAAKIGNEKQQHILYKKYFSWRKGVNNWDLVDSSAPTLSGHFYFHHDDSDLYKLLQSKNLWERRIAVLSCFYFIRQKSFSIPLKIIEARLYDKEDLMHKACGWMLREIGKRDLKVLRNFLKTHAGEMPRTALRYSIEKMSADERKKWMDQKLK